LTPSVKKNLDNKPYNYKLKSNLKKNHYKGNAAQSNIIKDHTSDFTQGLQDATMHKSNVHSGSPGTRNYQRQSHLSNSCIQKKKQKYHP